MSQGPQAFIDVETAQRLVRDAKEFELISGDDSSPKGKDRLFRLARVLRITKCALSTGYAEGQFLQGDPGGTLTLETSPKVKVFIGKHSRWRVGSDVLVVPVACPSLVWWAVAGVNDDVLYADPATDGSTLAPIQDNPSAEVYCSDSVQVP